MSRLARGLASLLALLGGANACGSTEAAAGDAPGARAEAIIGGEVSEGDQNSAVLIWNNRNSSWCTGAIVAPTLVLTARHCLFRYAAGPNNIVKCNEQGLTSSVYDSYDPADLTVSIGKEVGRELVVEAAGVEIYSSKELDLCLNDVALLELDTPLSEPIYPLRLDSPPEKGERGVLVGWGATEADIEDPDPSLTKHRRQREIEVLAVGPTNFRPDGGTTRYIEEATFIATEAGCQGDSGGPLISTETGAVFGVMHAMQTPDPTQGLESEIAIADCLGGFTVLHRLDIQEEWIRRAFQSAGAAPWIEGRPLPRGLGEACELGDDCVSGLCIRAGESAFCSTHCDDAACPSGMQCVGPEFDRVCSLPEVESAESSAGGCAVVRHAGKRRSSSRAALVLLTAAAFAHLRRRNRRLQALRDSV